MHTRRILGCLLFAAASLLAFSEIYALFILPEHPMLPNFRHDYLVNSSIENFGFAIPAIVIGLFMLRSRARYWLWFALIVAGFGSWSFVFRELWLHYYELPHMYPHFAAVHPPYFTGPLWWVLVRLSWHITLPAAFILAVVLLLSRAPDNSPEPT
jgi:uncharacterized membrane protein YozB (DUF420 family)